MYSGLSADDSNKCLFSSVILQRQLWIHFCIDFWKVQFLVFVRNTFEVYHVPHACLFILFYWLSWWHHDVIVASWHHDNVISLCVGSMETSRCITLWHHDVISCHGNYVTMSHQYVTSLHHDVIIFAKVQKNRNENEKWHISCIWVFSLRHS